MKLEDDDFLLARHRSFNYSVVEIAEIVFKLKLRPKQAEILLRFFETDQNLKPLFEECLLICGKKGGKTFLIAVMNLILIYKSLISEKSLQETFGLLADQDIYLLNTCAGKDQSIKIYLNQVKSIINNSPFLKRFKLSETVDEIYFRRNLILKAQSSRSTSSLGFLCLSVTFDELAWFEDSNNRNSSKSCYEALLPNIKPFGEFGRSFILTSPSDTGTWFFGHYEFAKVTKSKLVVQHPTWVMNPNITRESLETEFRRDFDKATMDWGGEFIEAIGGAFIPAMIDKAIVLDVRDISIKDKRQRVIALDPALKRDAYALAMGYIESYKVYIDYVHIWQGTRENPVKISGVEDHIRFLNKNYVISKTVLDQRFSASTIQKLGAEGLPIFETFFDSGYKQKMYQVLKEKLNMSEVFLPHHARVKSELMALRRKGSGARITYEAPTSGPVRTDDMADAIANCVYQLTMLNAEGAEGTDDFAIDGDHILLDEESLKKEFEALPAGEKARREEEIKKKQKEDERIIKQVEEDGGFLVS